MSVLSPKTNANRKSANEELQPVGLVRSVRDVQYIRDSIKKIDHNPSGA